MSATPEPGTERTLRSSVRNPRRRQRQSDGDSIKTAPRRKRSKLSENTFAARETTEETDEAEEAEQDDGVAGMEVTSVMNGRPPRGGGITARAARKESTPMLDHHTDLPVRGGKKGGGGTLRHRPLKGDGATVLAQNKVYNVKLLPSTPKELRKEGLEYRGSLLGAANGQHLALAVTREKAYVWDYSAHTPVSNAKVFDVPFSSPRAGDAPPFGALVAGAVSTDMGLVLISSTTGKIVFYESIERAASLGLFQDRKMGVEGSITAFSSSETVTDVVSADHAGFILTLSSGRIIQLTLRDAQGKARVFTQPLRPGDANAGLFGSIKGWYSGAWKRDVTAVRTRALDKKGQMQTLALTERCELQIWDVDWSGRYEFRGTVDFQEMLIGELKSLEAAEMQGSLENVMALDFVIVDLPRAKATGDEITVIGAEQPISIWLLLKSGTPDVQDYYLANLSIAGEMANIERTVKLESYHGQSTGAKPRLVLPKPGHTAFVTFEDAVVLVATTGPELVEDPNVQLHDASYVPPESFEDAVYLQSGKGLSILHAVVEDTRSGHSSSVAFVKGAGLVRLSATDPSGDVERSRIPVKSKIEQAVFYGALQETILDFSRKGDNPYPMDAVEEAALVISSEILRSETPYVSSLPTSIETNLDYRARALRALVTHVRQNYPMLSRKAMWQMLWDAEKVAAAQQMWKAFEEHKMTVQAGDKARRKATIVDELCAQFEQEHGLDELEETREDDLVRRFFVKGLARIDYLLSRMRGLLESMRKDHTHPPEKVVRSVAEADDLWMRAMQTAFAFRCENAGAYGINPSIIDDGVLKDRAEMSELPEFWTSTTNMLKAGSAIPTSSREVAKDYFEDERASEDVLGTVKQITERMPGIIKLCCLIYQERINWLLVQSGQKEQSLAAALKANYDAERYDQFRGLASIGLAEQGMQLAERYRDMQTLTELVVGESQYYVDEMRNNPNMGPEQRAICADLMTAMTGKIGKYFDKFGEDWANAFFDEAFSGSRAGNMLEEAQMHWKGALTRYLRADAERGKICWINDVTAERDYGHAGVALTQVGVEQEARLWGKKVELSLSKLALLAAQEKAGDQPSRPAAAYLDEAMRKPERQLQLVEVQEKLYRHVHCEVLVAIDHEAEVQIAMEKFGNKTAEYPALRPLLEMCLDRLLLGLALSVDELIDVLTLSDSYTYDTPAEAPEDNLDGTEFALALKALNAAAPGLPQDRFETLLQLIWKRCYTADDWVAITSVQAQKGHTDTAMKLELRETVPWRTFFQLHDEAFLTSPDCNVRVLQPSECLGAACRPEHLSYRFAERDLLDPILHDNKIQDEILQGFVADRRVDEWVAECEGDAKGVVEEKAEHVAAVREQEREMQERKASEEKGVNRNGNGNGNGVHGVNGHVNGFLKGGPVGGTDLDGDVEME